MESNRYLTFGSVKEQIRFEEAGDNKVPFYQMYLRLEKNKEFVWQRRYKKLVIFLAEVGGTIKFLMFIGALICRPIARFVY